MTFEDVRRFALALPGVTEGSSYGTPALRVRKKFLARLKEDGDILVLRAGLDDKEHLMEVEPTVFFETDHYKGWPAVLVRLGIADESTVQGLLVQNWRQMASKAQVKAFDAHNG